MDEEITHLLISLKRVLKASGLRYSDVARALGISEMTVKRRMSGKGLSLAMLKQFCSVANLTLTELVELSQRDAGRKLPFASIEQTREMSKDLVLGISHILLSNGWPPDRIARELKLDHARMTAILIRLDKLGVIALFPGDRVRLLRRFNADVGQESHTLELVARRVHELFDGLDLTDPAVAWRSGLARLSPRSFSRIAKLLENLREAVFNLGEDDLALPHDEVTWYSLFAVARPVPIELLLHEPTFAPT